MSKKKTAIIITTILSTIGAFGLVYNHADNLVNPDKEPTITEKKEETVKKVVKSKTIEKQKTEPKSTPKENKKIEKIETIVNQGVKELYINSGHVNEDILKNILDFNSLEEENKILSYSGISFEQDISEIYENYNSHKLLNEDFIDIIDPYGNQIRFTNCSGSGISKSSSNSNAILSVENKGHSIICHDENTGDRLSFNLIKLNQRIAQPIDQSKPMERIFHTTDKGIEVETKNIKYQESKSYSITYRITNPATQVFHFGKIDGKTNTGVVIATTERLFYF